MSLIKITMEILFLYKAINLKEKTSKQNLQDTEKQYLGKYI